MSPGLPPPIAGTAVGTTEVSPSAPTLPRAAAVGAMAVLTVSLVASKYVLDAVVGFGWPVAVYVAMLALVGYGPSLWWCRYVSRRWGTGRLGPDIGLTPRLADLGWGPVIWLGAIAAQVAVGAVVIALGVPLVGNTDGIEEIRADRTYVVSLVITAVIAAPIVEEMVFRGVVMRGLRSRLPLVGVIVLQGLLFGVAHVDPVRGAGNIGLVLVLGGVGIAFGVAAVLLGRIGPSIVAHAIFNAAVLLIVLTGLAERLQDERSSAVVPPEPTSVLERIGVVDQAHLAEPDGDRDAQAARSTIVGLDLVHRLQRVGGEDADVVEFGEWFVLDDPGSGGDHGAGVRVR